MGSKKKSKEYWVAYHLKSLDYFNKQLDKKLSKIPSKGKFSRLKDSEIRSVIRTLKEEFKWYRNGVIYHKDKAKIHIEHEADWYMQLNHLESETDRKLSSIPHGMNMTKLDVGGLRIVGIELLDIVDSYKDEVENIRLKLFEKIEDTDKVQWATDKRDKENKSLENLFITADKFDEKYGEDFKQANEFLKKGENCIKKSKDPKVHEKVGKISKNKLDDMLKNPKNVGTIVDELFPEIFKTCGFNLEELGDFSKNVDDENKQKIVGLIANLRMMFFMQVVKDIDNDISNKISELFDLCEKKDRDALEKIFEKPRLDFLRKFISSFKKSWRLIDEKDLNGEPILENRVMMIKTFSEGIYKEILIVIQEMMQIAYGYKPTTGFGQIIRQIENAPDNMNLLANKIVYDIRNSVSHENVEYEDEKALIYDNKSKLQRELTIEELDENFKWISDLVNSTIYTLQIKYFNMMGIGKSQEEKMQYMTQVLFPMILNEFFMIK